MDNNRDFNNQGGRGQREVNNYFDEPRRRPSQPNSGRGGGHKRPKKKKVPVALLIVIYVVLAALLLLIFYVTNYMVKTEIKPTTLPTPKLSVNNTMPTATQPIESASLTPAGSTEPTSSSTIDPSDWRAKFADKFTSGDVEQTDNSYKSANINISIQKEQKDNVTYYVADIYVAELKYLKTAFPIKSDVMGEREHVDKIAGENNALLAINGDNCLDNNGLVIRNGQLYPRDTTSADVLVVNYDGTMQTYSPGDYDKDKIVAEGAYQSWAFGPMLLQNGETMTQFNSTQGVGGPNPRTAMGYYEPGHYCFVVVDGRPPQPTDGYTFEQMSQLFHDLGCKAAYNMDGGQSSQMVFNGKYVNQPYKNGRPITDIVYIGE